MEMLMEEEEKKQIVMIGEIGGQDEEDEEKLMKEEEKRGRKKKMVGLIEGSKDMEGRKMGNEGEVIQGGKGGEEEKIEDMEQDGIRVQKQKEKIGKKMVEVIKG